MDNDFNVSAALSIVFMFVSYCYDRLEEDRKTGGKGGCNKEVFSKLDAAMALEQMYAWDKILGVMNFSVEIPEDVVEMVAEREILRDGKMWAESDELRSKLNALGYSLDDTPNGTIVRKDNK
jgi:cysteinyl-tRNA synthetase